jgi:L-threonylcarbamoyladenylate synthase
MDLRAVPLEEAALDGIVDHLRSGGLLVYPTETVYGLGCLLRPGPLGRLAEFKGRDPARPFLVLVGDPSWVGDLAWTRDASQLADVFWPGSVTLVLADRDRRFPLGVVSPAGGVAVRQSPHPLVSRLVTELAEPLVSTSANLPGRPPASTGEEAGRVGEALSSIGDVLFLDVGGLPPSPVSTIVDCTSMPPRVLRAGATPLGRLRCVVPSTAGAPTD